MHREEGRTRPSFSGPQLRDAKSVLLFLNSKRGSCQESAAAVECAGPAVQLIPGKASTQWESKERRRGGKREEGEGGKQSLKAWTSTPGEAGSCHRAVCSPAPPCPGLPAQQPCRAPALCSWSTFLPASHLQSRSGKAQTKVCREEERGSFPPSC